MNPSLCDFANSLFLLDSSSNLYLPFQMSRDICVATAQRPYAVATHEYEKNNISTKFTIFLYDKTFQNIYFTLYIHMALWCGPRIASLPLPMYVVRDD